MATQTIERSREAARALRLPPIVERWLLPLALCGVALACYLTTLSDVHTFDALSYIRDVDQRAGFFFHPHHLLYSPTGWIFWQLWRLAGYDGTSELALKVLNSLAAAVCGFGMYRLTLGIAGRWWAAFLAAGVLLFNYGVWYFGVDVEVYHLALVWLLACLALMLELVTRPRPRTAPLLGACLGIAALYHQTNGLLVPVVVAAALLSPSPLRVRIRGLLLAGAISAAVVIAGYAVVAFGVNGIRTLDDLREWMFFFINTGWWGHATRDRLTDLGAGLGNTISTTGALPFWIVIIALLLAGLPLAARRWPRIVAVCAVWVLLYGAFFFWWEGENIEFWIATLMPLWLLLGLGVACLGTLKAGSTGVAGKTGQAALILGCVVFPLLLARHNYPIVERRGDASQDLQRQLADKLGATSAPQDMIVSTGGVLELYLPYYEDRHYIRTINMVLFESGGELESGFEKLRAEIDTALHAGLAVYVGHDAVELPQFVRQRYNLTQDTLDALWAPYSSTFQPAVEHDGTIYFWRIPPASELAQEGWRWTGGPLGWQSANLAGETFDAAAGGWCFNPQVDPSLTGPLFGLDAAGYNAVEVTMRTTAPGEAQLFFAAPDNGMSDERSVRWTPDADGQSHIYTLPLAETPGWQGVIGRLRLDPVPLGDGSATTRTCVEQIRLVAGT